MRVLNLLAANLFLFAISVHQAFALGADHGKEQLAAQCKNCVHGFFVNESDVFFYTGDAAEFTKFATEQAIAMMQQNMKLQIVIHQGTKKARSPWDKADRDIAVDWSITTGPMVLGRRLNKDETDLVRIDLWLGGHVKKDDIKFPPGIELVNEPAEKLATEKPTTDKPTGNPPLEKK